CGAAVGGLCTAAAAVVQRHQAASTRAGSRRWWYLAGSLPVLLAVLAAVAVASGRAAWGLAVAWSGPWGWAALPPAAVAGAVPAWAGVVGGALTVLCATGALGCARRAAMDVPARVLRAQGRLAFGVTAALYAFDLRNARALTTGVHHRRRRRRRLPPPRGRTLLVPWRDLTALLRSPVRLAVAPLWSAAGVVLLALAAGVGAREPAALLGLTALGAGCLGALNAAEGARLDGDDPRRASQLAFSHASLALRHAAVPVLLGWLGAGVGLLGCALLGLWHPVLPLLPATVPALVGAALVTAYRGPAPPLGVAGAGGVLLWNLRGPLVVVALAAPAYRAGGGLAAAAWLALLACVVLAWARRLAATGARPAPHAGAGGGRGADRARGEGGADRPGLAARGE
ncbi:hypothetical protein GL263_13435, partial [Streptomyces durbertensis]|nr:hypothetical protein [Streptomyces durbertensis]